MDPKIWEILLSPLTTILIVSFILRFIYIRINRRIDIPYIIGSSRTTLEYRIEGVGIFHFCEFYFTYSSDTEEALRLIDQETLNYPFCSDNSFLKSRPQEHIRIINCLISSIAIKVNNSAGDIHPGVQLRCDLFRYLLNKSGEDNIEIQLPLIVTINK